MNQTNSDGQEFRNSLRRSLIPTGKDLLQWASYAGGFALIMVLSALFTQRALLSLLA